MASFFLLPFTQKAGRFWDDLSRAEIGCALVAILFSVIVAASQWSQPLLWDEKSYWNGSAALALYGPFYPYELFHLRTYGYPALLLPARVSSYLLGEGLARLLLLMFQLPVYLGAAAFLRGSLRELFGDAIARQTFCALCLNFYVLIYACFGLTEVCSLAANLVFFSLLIGLVLPSSREPRKVFGAAFLASVAVMIRPANVYLYPVLALFIPYVLRGRLGRRQVVTTTLLLVFGACLPLTLQYRNNLVNWHKNTPLVAADLGTLQLELGKVNIKSATFVGVGRDPVANYKNPFYHESQDPDPSSPWVWYRARPADAAATLCLKLFNLVDQDLPLPYNTDLDPPYRRPMTLLNHLLVFLGLVGVVHALARCRRSRLQQTVAVLLSLGTICYLGLHLPTAVEGRFGLGLLVLLGAFVPHGWRVTRHEGMGTGLKVLGLLYLGLALWLSAWVHLKIV